MSIARLRGLISKPGLALRLAMVLSVAVLPLGLISVYQTNKVVEERQILSGAALLEETQEAVSVSRDILRSAASSAETLSVTVPVVRDAPETCNAIMAEVVAKSPDVIFAGHLDENFNLACTSSGKQGELKVRESLRDELMRREPAVVTRALEFLGAVATVNVTAPVIEKGVFRGTIWIAVPLTALNDALARAAPEVDLVLFQPDGQVLATEDFTDDRRSVLPKDRPLKELAALGRHTFRGENRDGQLRDFAVSPIVENSVFVIGSWLPRHRGMLLSGYSAAIALYFPIIMWVIAILASFIGVHRLAVRHVRRLRSWIRLYGAGHSDFSNARLDNAPAELEEMADAFRAMTARLSEHDRRQQEDLQEKIVLLREVHHRVKNNLQLISSIMNMQVRTTDSPEAKHLLRRVQDRVMALSAVHRYLYLARKLSLLRADELLSEIVQHTVAVGSLEEAGHEILVSTEFDPLEISPDQSVPLSLLVSEAAINAVKHSGAPPGENPWINIALKRVDDDQVALSVVNSRTSAEEAEDGERSDGSGLGSRLISSFVAQLNGALEVRELDDRYELHVTFPLAWPEEEDEELPPPQ